MRTVRRLYVYLVTLISLELIVWGLINLLQNSLSVLPRTTTNVLASGLSLVLVGIPFFVLHGWLAQREALRDSEERTSRVRALFHYAARLALLGPVIFQLFDLVRYPLELLLGLTPALSGRSGSTPLDNGIAIFVNCLAWAAMESLLRSDWRSAPTAGTFIETRRLSRYIWMLYGLGFMLIGIVQVLQYLLYPVSSPSYPRLYGLQQLATGLALILVGVPLWVYRWGIVQRTQNNPEERPSTLRLVVLFGLVWGSALVVMFSSQVVLDKLFHAILGQPASLSTLLQDSYEPLSLAISFGVLWLYFARPVRLEIAAGSGGMRRIYGYVLALAGNGAVFAGAWQVLGGVVEDLVMKPLTGIGTPFAGGLAWLVVGLPYWLLYWPPLQAEARRADETGDHARRSVIRKSYLYLVVFLAVVAIMSAAGILFYRLINAALGNPGVNLALESWQQVRTILLVAVWLAYHLGALRADGRLALRSLGDRQAAFPVLVLGSGQSEFDDELIQTLRRLAPRLPVTLRDAGSGVPEMTLPAPKVLVLPAALAVQPPVDWQAWLNSFSGARILVPLAADGWIWSGQPARTPADLAHATAAALRQLSEGQSLRQSAPTSPWAVAGFILGGIFALILGLILIVALFSGLN